MKNKTLSRFIPKTRGGFTVVELLIVIVVIGILAAIVIVAYNGIRVNSIEASMQSDLRTASTILDSERVRSGSYPASASAANGGVALKKVVIMSLPMS